MSALALSGNDTINIDNRVLTDFADGSYGEVIYDSDIANVKTGKNGNSIFSYNATGRMGMLKLRIIRGSSDDKYLNGKLSAQQSNFEGTVLAQGEVIKKVGDGTGAITNDVYILASGVYTKQVEAKANAEGDTEQSVALYTIKFANITRAIT